MAQSTGWADPNSDPVGDIARFYESEGDRNPFRHLIRCKTSGRVIADPSTLNAGTWKATCPACGAELLMDDSGRVPNHAGPGV